MNQNEHEIVQLNLIVQLTQLVSELINDNQKLKQSLLDTRLEDKLQEIDDKLNKLHEANQIMAKILLKK